MGAVTSPGAGAEVFSDAITSRATASRLPDARRGGRPLHRRARALRRAQTSGSAASRRAEGRLHRRRGPCGTALHELSVRRSRLVVDAMASDEELEGVRIEIER